MSDADVKKKKSSKRKTLVKDFKEIAERGNDEEIKAVFQKCDINAYDALYKSNALRFDLPKNVVRWLVDQGADLEYRDPFRKTPLFHQVVNAKGHPEFLIRLGANVEAVDGQNETPLFIAARYFRLNHIKTLVEAGADLNHKNDRKETPLLRALSCARNGDIPELVEIARYLLENGAELTGKEREQVTRIGTEFEWSRDRINRDYVDEIESSLVELYRLFDVAPVPKRNLYDGTSRITVKAKTWQNQHEELWQLLVPSSGKASTMQGEVIRISGRLSHEILDNGAANWDAEYAKMANALSGYLNHGSSLAETEYNEIQAALHAVRNASEGQLERLTALCVKWVLLNPEPIQLGSVTYSR